MKIWALFFILFSSLNCFALKIPKLNRTDLRPVVETLGYGTATRFLSNPFPLGGYTGFEIGYTYEVVDVADIAFLGAGTNDQKDDLTFSRLAIGKGLYNDLDAFFEFTPVTNSDRINDYGAGLKWNFYQAKFIPFSLSVLGTYNSVSIEDVYTNENVAGDIIGGINVDSFALYFGGGLVSARSRFSKDILNFTAPYARESDSSSHSFVGVHFEISRLFVAAQIDRYVDPVYSLKLGYRQ